MKKIFLLFTFAFLAFSLVAQTPQLINYQAVARNANGNPLTNQGISVNFKIKQGQSGTPALYEENQNTTSNMFGLFTLQIGKVNPTGFAAIDWASGSKWLEVTINGSLQSSQELVSVPYALYAEKTKPLPITHLTADQTTDPFQTSDRMQYLPVPGAQLTVPENGTYLVLANLGGTATSGDSGLNGFVGVLTPGSINYLFDFRIQPKPNGQLLQNAPESTGWKIITLKKNDIIRLDLYMGSWANPVDSTPFVVTRGKIALIKLN